MIFPGVIFACNELRGLNVMEVWWFEWKTFQVVMEIYSVLSLDDLPGS